MEGGLDLSKVVENNVVGDCIAKIVGRGNFRSNSFQGKEVKGNPGFYKGVVIYNNVFDDHRLFVYKWEKKYYFVIREYYSIKSGISDEFRDFLIDKVNYDKMISLLREIKI